jgi:hypothetical protein
VISATPEADPSDSYPRRTSRYGWEVQCLYDGVLAYGQRFLLKADALEEAEATRRRSLGEGRQILSPPADGLTARDERAGARQAYGGHGLPPWTTRIDTVIVLSVAVPAYSAPDGVADMVPGAPVLTHFSVAVSAAAVRVPSA